MTDCRGHLACMYWVSALEQKKGGKAADTGSVVFPSICQENHLNDMSMLSNECRKIKIISYAILQGRNAQLMTRHSLAGLLFPL